MPRGEFGIDLRAFSQKFKSDLKKADKAYQKWTKGLAKGAKKVAPAIGAVEKKIQSLAAQIRATNSVAKRFALQFRKDLINLSNIFVRRFTFTIATSIEQAILRLFRLPLVLLKNVIKVGSEFEDAVLKTAAVTAGGVDGLRDAFDRVSEAARTLGRESVFTAVEISKAMFELASVGLTVDEQFLAIQASANFAAAAQTDLMTSTNLLTQIMKAYGLQGEDLARVSDVLTFAFNTTTINVERLVEAMKFAAPAGAAFGVNFKETVAVIAGFVDVTKQGGISGRAFRFMLAALGKPSSAALEAIARLNIELRDVNPRFASLSDIMETFARSGLNASDAMVIFGKRAGPVVMSFIRRFRIGLAFGINDLEKFKEGLDLEKNVGLAAKQAEIFRTSITNQFRILASKGTDLLIRLFFRYQETFQSMLVLGIAVLDKLSNNFGKMEDAAESAAEQVKILGTVLLVLGAGRISKSVLNVGAGLVGVSVGAKAATSSVKGLRGKFAVLLQLFTRSVPIFSRVARFIGGKAGIVGVFITLFSVLSKASEITGGVGKVFSRLGLSMDTVKTAVVGLGGAYATFTTYASNLLNDSISMSLQLMVLLRAEVTEAKAVLSERLGGFSLIFGDAETLRKQAESLRQFAGQLSITNQGAKEALALRERMQEIEEDEAKRVIDRRAAAQQEIVNLETFREKQEALFIGFVNLRAAGNTFEEALNLLGDEIETVGIYSENTGEAMFSWFEFLPEGWKRVKEGTVALTELEGQTKATAISFRDFLNKEMGIFSKVFLPEDTLNRIEEAFSTLEILAKEFSGTIRLQMVENVRETMNAHIQEIQRTRDLTEVEIAALTDLYRTFPTRLAAPFQEGEEIIFAFATDATKALEGIPEKVDKEEVKKKSRDIFNSISREFGKAIADMLVDAKGFVDAMTRLMKGLFTDTMFNLFTDFTSVFKDELGEDGEVVKEGLKGMEGLKAGWGKFKDGLTANGGIFNSVLAGFSAMSGSITSIAFAGFNAILQFVKGNWAAGIISVVGMVVGIIKKAFGKTTVEEAAKGIQIMLKGVGKVSLDVAKDIEELARELKDAGEKGAKFAAIASSLGKVLEETGIRTTNNFTFATREMIFALERAKQGLFDEKFAIEGVSEAFPILIENMDKMGSEGAANIRRIIDLTREMGIEIEAVTKFVTDMTTQGAGGMNALADSIETLTDGQLATMREAFNFLAVEMLKNGSSILDVIEAFGPLLEAAGAAGIDLGGHFSTILSIAEKIKVEGVAPIVAQMEAWQVIMESISNLGGLTEDTFIRLSDSVVDSFQKLIDSGFTMEEALLLSSGTLAELIDLANRYGFELSAGVLALIEAAEEEGILLETQDTLLSVMRDIREVLEDMRDIMAGVGMAGEDAFNDIRDAGIGAGEDIEDFWKDMDLSPEIDPFIGPGGIGGPFAGLPEFARGGVVPPTPSGSLVARVHDHEIIGAPEQIVSAMQTALGRMGKDGTGGVGDIIYAPKIEVRIGRRVFREEVREVIEKGTIDGDIRVNSESVFRLT